MMKHERLYWWYVYILWPLLGGTWGAWLGFRGYFQVQLNADTFAPIFVFGFYALFALIGLSGGAALCALVGLCVDRLLRYLGMGMIAALTVVTLLNGLALWQVGDFVQTKYPGLRAKQSAKTDSGNVPRLAPAETDARQNPCSERPAADTKEREIWDSECR